MKRKRFTVEGDVVDCASLNDKPRYVGSHELLSTKETPSLRETHFWELPIELTYHILCTVAQNNNPHDYQAFLRYLLPVYGVSLGLCEKNYDETRTDLLVVAMDALKDYYPALYQSCVKERLGRVDSTVSLIYDDVYSPFQHLESVRILVNTPFVELFAFANCRLCECCSTELAVSRNHSFSRVREAIDHDIVPLCAYCGSKMDYSRRVKDTEKIIDLGALRRKPRHAYRWLNEKKLRQWCSIPKTMPIALSPLATSIRKKIHRTRMPFTLYLLKDLLPFVNDRYMK